MFECHECQRVTEGHLHLSTGQHTVEGCGGPADREVEPAREKNIKEGEKTKTPDAGASCQ